MTYLQLHAHLSGSISRECLHDVWLQKKQNGETDLEDPLVEMPVGKFDYDLETQVLGFLLRITIVILCLGSSKYVMKWVGIGHSQSISLLELWKHHYPIP